jgi:four helix bundle protein
MNLELNKNKTFKQEFKKRCFHFSLAVLKIATTLRENRNNWILIDQLVRSATSIGANIVEGGNGTSKKEFVNYFQIAIKSASETLYWLALLREINSSRKTEIDKLIQECTEIKKIISTIILNTKNNSKL